MKCLAGVSGIGEMNKIERVRRGWRLGAVLAGALILWLAAGVFWVVAGMQWNPCVSWGWCVPWGTSGGVMIGGGVGGGPEHPWRADLILMYGSFKTSDSGSLLFNGRWRWMGFTFGCQRATSEMWLMSALPMWFVQLALSGLVVRAYVPWRRYRRRVREGLCLACGYDLRASEERCPECGRGIR